MKAVSCALWFILILVQFLPVTPAWPADTASTIVTADKLNARLKEVEAETSLDEASRGTLTGLLNNALGNLETIRANKATRETYSQAVKTASQKAKEIRAQLDKDIEADREVTVTATGASPLEEMEQKLLQEKANLAAVQAKLADLESRLEASKARPAIAQQQLLAAERDKEEQESTLKLPVTEDELPWVTEARHWAQTTRVAALRSKIAMLDQELLGMPMRIELLEAQRDQSAYTVERVAVRVNLLEVLASRKVGAEAEQAGAAARQAVSDAAGKHPLVQELAEQNAALTDEISTLAVEHKQHSASNEAITAEAKRVEENFRAAREKLEVARITEVLGQVLRQQQRALPDQRELEKSIRQLEQENAQSTLRRIQYATEYKGLRSIKDFIKERTAELEPAEAEQVGADMTELANARRLLLDNAISLDKSYSRSLTELETGNRRLLKTTADFDNLLAETLLWIRSAPRPNLATLQTIPGQVVGLVSPERWLDVLGALADRVVRSPVFMLLLGLVGFLLFKVRRLLALLRETGTSIGKPSQDKFLFTLKALGLTLLLAVPLPLLLAVSGWELGLVPEATQFTRVVATALFQVAPTFLYLQFFRILCVHGGVAERHFRWPESMTKQLRRGFRWLMAVLLPAIFILVLLINNTEQEVLHAGLERLVMAVALAALAVLFYRLTRLLIEHSIGPVMRLRYLWLMLTVATPLVVAVLAVDGYMYTAGTLGRSLVETLWFVFGLVVLHQVVVRWLLLTQRRLALQARHKRMLAAQEEKTPVDSGMGGMPAMADEPDIDLAAMSEESRKLLNMLLVIIGVVGFWLIWSEVLPAFRVLDEVVLWHHTVVVAGEEALAPVSLADIGLAILIAIVTYVAAKRLPALLEIVLLQRVNMTAGARYTVTTLYTYLIVGIGLLAFFNVIGADWSKLQWLFAALGVGIGFGLQEIVANFICGLILLVERPVRVGDLITVGDASGRVMRIRIRATTIRDFEQKELLIPNKGLITGQLVNWTLSDETTRILIQVGIAYGSDVDKAIEILLELAHEDERVLEEPPPGVVFDQFADSSLNLAFRVFVGTLADRLPVMTDMHRKIHRRFAEEGITIAFPQREVHIHPMDMQAVMPVGKDSKGDGPAQ